MGAARTAIGVAAGLAYGALCIRVLEKALIPRVAEIAMLSIYYFALLVPRRVAEWGFTIWLFFGRGLHDKRKLVKWIVLGIICSYLLDAIGFLGAFAVPGGFWICQTLKRDWRQDLIESVPVGAICGFDGPCRIRRVDWFLVRAAR